MAEETVSTVHGKTPYSTDNLPAAMQAWVNWTWLLATLSLDTGPKVTLMDLVLASAKVSLEDQKFAWI